MEFDVKKSLSKFTSNENSGDVDEDGSVLYDPGLLSVFDINPIDPSSCSHGVDEMLKTSATNVMKSFVRHLVGLPKEDGVIVLPPSQQQLPRSLPVPKPSQLTKWEQFAKEKGISKKKRDRKVFDEGTGEYAPRWGYGRSGSGGEWMREVKEGEAREMEMNALKEEKNKKKKAEKSGESEKKVSRALSIAAASTSSGGRRDEKIKGVKKAKIVASSKKESSLSGEKERSLRVLRGVVGNEAVVDMEKAAKAYGSSSKKRKITKKKFNKK